MNLANQCSIPDCDGVMYCKKLCSRHYWRQHRTGSTDIVSVMGVGETESQKFWSKVAITSNPDRCWEWQAGIYKGIGYGQSNRNGKSIGAHRHAWLLVTGEMPSKHILHSCDNRRCVNPKHLRDGTPQENYDDMVNRGRRVYTRGEAFGSAKLREADIRSIRADNRHQGEIAKQYGVDQGLISRIKTRKIWKHVEDTQC
jgi:hypothetical protein